MRRPALVLALALLPLTACGDDGPGPAGAAEALAAGLEARDLAGVPLTGDAPDPQADLAVATEGLGARPLAVDVREVTEDDGTATARLALSWDVGGPQPWAYETRAELVREQEQWRVRWSPAVVHPDRVEGDRLRASVVDAPRGEVLGAGGEVLVTDRPVQRVGLDKARVDPAQVAASATALAQAVDVDPAGYAARAQAAGPRAFVEAVVLRDDGSEPLASLDVRAVPGAVLLPDALPLAPTRTFARPLLGAVGDATAEVVEGSGGAVQPGQQVGLSGLQQQYDAQLRGTPGTTVELVRADETAGRVELFRSAAVAGTPLRLTLDAGLQTAAEAVLAGVAPASAVVALRPSTGEVLAAASGPGGDGLSTATVGQYAPGSTSKVVTSLALLRTGATPETVLPCTPTLTVDGRAFRNYSDFPASGLGDVPLRRALADSCNTAFLSARDRVDAAALADAAASLGVGGEADLGFPASLGDYPAEGSATAQAAALIGQGEVIATPLSVATVAASIAAGRTVTPRLVADAPDAPAPPTPLTAEEAAALRGLLRGVVETGSASFLADVPGEPVGAKTGTAEYGSDTPPRTRAWMLAVQGDLAVAVLVEDGASGSQTAGPLLEAFLRAVPGA